MGRGNGLGVGSGLWCNFAMGKHRTTESLGKKTIEDNKNCMHLSAIWPKIGPTKHDGC